MDQKFKCKICGLELEITDAIQHTLYGHNEIPTKPTDCPCGFIAKSYPGLKKHISKKHKFSSKVHEIPACLKYTCACVLESREELINHYRTRHSCNDQEIEALLKTGQQHVAPRQCPHCDEGGFTDTHTYTLHQVNNHPHRHSTITKNSFTLPEVGSNDE